MRCRSAHRVSGSRTKVVVLKASPQMRACSTPAIVISTHTTGLAVIRALGREGVPVIAMYYDDADIGCVSRYVQERILVPHPEKSEEGFIKVLLDRGRTSKGSLVVPCSDAALAAVSRNRAALQEIHRVACPEWEVTKRFLDKKYTYELADQIGVPAPRTVLLRSMEDVEKHGRAIEYPCLLKPSQGHRYFDLFRVKMARVEGYDELVVAYRRAAAAGLEVVLQELIPGDDSEGVNYNCYFWDGWPLVEFTAKKIKNAPPSLGSPCVVLSKPITEVRDAGRRLLAAGGFYGFACTEFKRDPRNGVYKLMEVNGRHNLSAQLAIRCGINFPWLQYQHLVGGILPEACNVEPGIYWIDPTRYLGNGLKHFSPSGFSLPGFLRPFLNPHVYADLDWTDPRPFAKRLAYLARKAPQLIRKRLEDGTVPDPESQDDRKH